MANNIIGEKLKSFRKAKGLSVIQVAENLLNNYQIQIAEKTIYGWEAGRSQPDIDTFLSLCNIYGVSNEDFLNIGRQISDKESQEPSSADQSHLKKYQRLNDAGKAKLEEQLDDMLSLEKYTAQPKPAESLDFSDFNTFTLPENFDQIRQTANELSRRLRNQSGPVKK